MPCTAPLWPGSPPCLTTRSRSPRARVPAPAMRTTPCPLQRSSVVPQCAHRGGRASPVTSCPVHACSRSTSAHRTMAMAGPSATSTPTPPWTP
uniref:Uncharacterized protein n=1 Tax=Arundo donax TaxID=35708 RepID=A0A0A9BH26_ARUDO